ncbi:hypothetical protein ACFZDK_50465 [Streptomyces sp. NPDC007901]|uniref:hypothetical protein n=1 Tax=Streptomyces sp. NPDC007901 TaxID=3364785 RepID=UPI0036E771D0
MADQQTNRTRESRSTIDPAHVLTPTQLLAAVLVLLVVSVPAFIAGAATTTSPGWVPAMFAVAAVLDVPLASPFHEAGCPAGGQESRKCL